MNTLYLLAKTVHIIGFIVAIGVIFCTHLAYIEMWKIYSRSPAEGISAFRSYERLQRAGMWGLLITIVAGILMSSLRNWILLSSFWFQLKLALIGCIFINGFTLGRNSTLDLRAFLAPGGTGGLSLDEIDRLRKRVRFFQILQISFYLLIVILSIFRLH
jgi:hypothetical protein